MNLKVFHKMKTHLIILYLISLLLFSNSVIAQELPDSTPDTDLISSHSMLTMLRYRINNDENNNYGGAFTLGDLKALSGELVLNGGFLSSLREEALDPESRHYGETFDDITSLSGLEYATSITGLSVKGHGTINDISSISSLSSLSTLRIDGLDGDHFTMQNLNSFVQTIKSLNSLSVLDLDSDNDNEIDEVSGTDEEIKKAIGQNFAGMGTPFAWDMQQVEGKTNYNIVTNYQSNLFLIARVRDQYGYRANGIPISFSFASHSPNFNQDNKITLGEGETVITKHNDFYKRGIALNSLQIEKDVVENFRVLIEMPESPSDANYNKLNLHRGKRIIILNIQTELPPRPNPPKLKGRAGDQIVKLSWETPSDDNNKVIPNITNYRYRYKESDNSNWNEWTELKNTNTELTITGLTNEISYDFQVSAYATGDILNIHNGWSDESSINTINGLIPSLNPTIPETSVEISARVWYTDNKKQNIEITFDEEIISGFGDSRLYNAFTVIDGGTSQTSNGVSSGES